VWNGGGGSQGGKPPWRSMRQRLMRAPRAPSVAMVHGARGTERVRGKKRFPKGKKP